jgi:hypothetical protein
LSGNDYWWWLQHWTPEDAGWLKSVLHGAIPHRMLNKPTSGGRQWLELPIKDKADQYVHLMAAQPPGIRAGLIEASDTAELYLAYIDQVEAVGEYHDRADARGCAVCEYSPKLV